MMDHIIHHSHLWGVEIVSLNDDVTKPLTEREMLLLVTEKLTTLNEKIDEIRKDNASKYDSINTILNEHRQEINKINKWRYMIMGAIGFIGIALGYIFNLIY